MARISHIVCLLFASFVLGTVASQIQVPPSWEALPYYPSPDHEVSFKLALVQQNLEKLESLFWSVSDPDSDLYTEYLTHGQIRDIVAPAEEEVHILKKWLISHGVRSIDEVKTGDLLVAKAAVSTVEKMFNVRFQFFRHSLTGRVLARSMTRLTIPQDFASLIQLVHGINDFPFMMRKRNDPIVPKSDIQNRQGSSPIPGLPPAYGAVTVTYAAARPGELEVHVVPGCKTYTNNSASPCSGPAISGLHIRVVSALDSYNTEFYADVSGPLDCSFPTTNPYIPALCTIKVPLLDMELFVPLNVSVRMDLQGHLPGQYFYYPHVTVALPLVDIYDLYDLYDIPRGSRVSHPNATQCVVEFEQQYYSPSDLTMFFVEMGLDTSTPVTVIGPNNITDPGVEANLDIQWIMGMAPGSPTTFWSIYANSTAEIDDILQWEYAIGNMTNPPIVNSLSYGMTEDNVDTYQGAGYLNRSNVEFQKLALMGLTIIIAAGDTGSNDLGAPPMSQTKCQPAHADWPSDSPYVTSLASTYITPLSEPVCYLPKAQGGKNCLNDPWGEVSVSVEAGMRWTTGGGFSNMTSRPDYQNTVVEHYLTQPHVPPASYFNRNGRAYADVSTVGHNVLVAYEGILIPVDGTSASAPIFAGIVTLLNDARLSVGKKPLGFLNTMMYKMQAEFPSMFNDVVVGNNRCGALGWYPVCCPNGYPAAPGWDPISGLGTPNYTEMRRVVLGLK